MALVYSRHAADMLIERSIHGDWVEQTIEEPDFEEPDPIYRDRSHAFRALPERDGRVLRVVYTRSDGVIRIITLFLDRRRRSL